MFKYVKAVLKWVLRKETLANAIFAVRFANIILGNKDLKKIKKVSELKRKLEIAQGIMDSLQAVVSNQDTASDSNFVQNASKVKALASFAAKIITDKHGPGNNGITLSFRK